MIARLLHPLRTSATWRALVHGLLDMPVGGRLLAFHGVDLPDPVPPLEEGSWWSHFKQRLTSSARWEEIGYSLLRLRAGVLFASVLCVLWSGSTALVLLPLYVQALPGDVARFGLFEVGFGPGAFAVAAGASPACWSWRPGRRWSSAGWTWHWPGGSLGLDPEAELAAQVKRAETRRAAAVDAAESERRRVGRDLHDGAQQRLVSLARNRGRTTGRARSRWTRRWRRSGG